MSAPGRSQALMPKPAKGEGLPISAPGRSQALMPKPAKGEGLPIRAPGRSQALMPKPAKGEGFFTGAHPIGWAGLVLLSTSSAWAHGGHATVEGDGPWAAFATGFLHPLTGPDHVIAMVAVGLWGAVLGAPSLWLLPVIFPLVMAVGGMLALLGMPLPGVEIGIALSGLLLGLVVALRWRAPLALAAVLVGAFAVFHGHAHGTELPQAASPLLYSLGFVVATGLLHLAGVGLGALGRSDTGWRVVRGAGGLIALGGLWFLVRAV